MMSNLESAIIPLNMMEKSVDDMYDGCSKEMDEKVKNEYFPREMKNNQLFRDAWKKTESCVNDKYNKDKALTKDQVQALGVYTGNDVYGPFNAAVRVSADKYTTSAFKYHALHYWLTTALQTLNNNKICRTTYRRSRDTFTGQLDQEIRFGQFASSSVSPDVVEFGNETCFQIETCLGAPINEYSCYSTEDEVLIPPYEKFKIMKIVQKSYEQLENCTTIFVLKPVGHKTNLNCKAAYVQAWFRAIKKRN
ncbi:ecto-ADP-ribosyltransferase 4-like [Boleophthalmus pectinirostris]|uniref:ecto-ADP-ribosyltransferase 4-like n=1 Tax=Boleophthalmus pectinirostris TaxID=150288 RepID=UPI00243057E5|nr:ecto-ADP-ribosyltransferase 4-like [Boleophthalmus pectinirostris]